MRSAVRAGARAALAAVALSAALRGAEVDDEWPVYGHDGALTGRSRLKGDMASPREAWSLSLAGEEWEIEVRPEAGRQVFRLPGDAPTAPRGRTIVVPGPALRDLDGSGALRPAVETFHQRWEDILPGVKGLERIGWDQTWTTARTCHLELYAHDQGLDHPRLVWRSEPEDTVFNPLCVVKDLDGDGAPEICVALHYRVMIYDGATGRKETELRFHQSRSYGWFGIGELDGDPAPELVVISDFQSHIDVLDYDPRKPEPERLSVKWRRDIETAIEDRKRWPQVGPRPLADLTGDGRPEIVVNLFNDAGDGEWHAVALDAATGKTVLDLPRRFQVGAADVDGDGRAELFCAATRAVAVLPALRAEIVGLRDGAAKVRWEREDAGFVQADLPRLGPDWSTTATQGMRQVLLTEGPRPAFLILESEPAKDRLTVGLSALRGDPSGRIDTLWTAQGIPPHVEALAIAGSGLEGQISALLRVVQPPESLAGIETENCKVEVAARRPRGTAPHAPVAARLEPGGPVCVLVQGAGEEIFCIRPPARGGKPEVIWRRPGRGIGNGSQPGTLAVADLIGDGRREVIAAAETPSGGAEILALRGDGSVFWRRSFPGFPGETPVHNIGGLPYFWPGRFRSVSRADLFVNLRFGLMHSDLGVLLDGRTGEEVWRREKAIAPGKFRWGFSGAPLAVADLFGDRRDELVCLYPVCYWVADGSTGEFLAAEELASRKVVPAWAAYGEPMVHDFDGDGTREVLLDSPYQLALLDRDGKARWHGKPKADYPTGRAEDNPGEATAVRHALLDLDGDGRPEIASAGYRDGVRAIDPRDGAILWSLEAPAPTVPRCSAADLDGDGGDELLYAAGNQLVAVKGDRKGGRILWSWTPGGPAGALSLPAIADLDGDGRAEIAVQSADGVLHVIDGPER